MLLHEKYACLMKNFSSVIVNPAIQRYLFLKSPRFQACMNSPQAKGLNMFCGGICPAE